MMGPKVTLQTAAAEKEKSLTERIALRMAKEKTDREKQYLWGSKFRAVPILI